MAVLPAAGPTPPPAPLATVKVQAVPATSNTFTLEMSKQHMTEGMPKAMKRARSVGLVAPADEPAEVELTGEHAVELLSSLGFRLT